MASFRPGDDVEVKSPVGDWHHGVVDSVLPACWKVRLDQPVSAQDWSGLARWSGFVSEVRVGRQMLPGEGRQIRPLMPVEEPEPGDEERAANELAIMAADAEFEREQRLLDEAVMGEEEVARDEARVAAEAEAAREAAELAAAEAEAARFAEEEAARLVEEGLAENPDDDPVVVLDDNVVVDEPPGPEA